MASPHVAGLVALLISAQPGLAGQVDQLENLIEHSAVPIYTSEGCGGDTPSSHPNHTYGWGRIDAWAALSAAPYSLDLKKTVSAAVTVPGSPLTYTLTVTNNNTISTTHNLILVDTIPEHTNFITATLPHTLKGDTVSWALGDLAAGAAAHTELEVWVPITTPIGTIINNQYSAHSDEVTAVFGDPVTTTIHKLAVEKTAADVVVRGYPLTYTLTVQNLQPDAITHQVLLTDTIPEGTHFISATGSYSENAGLVTWEMGDLAAEASSQVEMVVQVPMTRTGIISNTSYGAVSEEVTTPARGDAVQTFVHQPGLWLQDSGEKWASPGDQVPYEVVLTNTGNYTDSIQIQISSLMGWTIPSTEIVRLGAEQSYTIAFLVDIPISTPGGQSDTTTVTASSQADPNNWTAVGNITNVKFRQLIPYILSGP